MIGWQQNEEQLKACAQQAQTCQLMQSSELCHGTFKAVEILICQGLTDELKLIW
jgi:hypothetical protein